MHLHFDADPVVYRAGFAAEKMHYYCEGQHFQYKKEVLAWLEEQGLSEEDVEIEKRREPEPVRNALFNTRSIVDSALKRVGVQDGEYTLYLSGSTNFRDTIATILPYKGNRDDKDKPIHAPAIREYLQERYPVVMSDGEEADDVISYTHYAMYCEDDMSSIISTIDKDLDMIPGLHYNFVTERSYNVTPQRGLFLFQTQLLKGDTVDNIPGIPGIGKVYAVEKLTHPEIGKPLSEKDRWITIRTMYQQHYGDKWWEALTEVGILLWMRRKPQEMWSPPAWLKETD